MIKNSELEFHPIFAFDPLITPVCIQIEHDQRVGDVDGPTSNSHNPIFKDETDTTATQHREIGRPVTNHEIG